ncbi:MAG: 23S rRNA (uracil(1939)-C(5))-methyltransferase RlmD [Cyanobacteriota bacterium]|nr:23S rRNA (uracil(1939)-C(5))-methyltransferase RlmD [Cyanobacteriota bacterium]
MTPASASGDGPPAGEPVLLQISDLNIQGEGVGRLDGEVVFVPQALPGEQVLVRLGARRRGPRHGVLLERRTSSPARIRPPCILADHCGGCSTQHLCDPAERQWKRERVEQALRRIGGLETTVLPVMAAPDPLHYRNRATIPLSRDAAGRLRAGFYRRGSHRIVNMNHCPVLDPRLDALIGPLKQDLEQSGWPVDPDLEAGGGLRHLALRLGVHTDEVLITLISSHDQLDHLEDYANRWCQQWPQVVGVTLNLQPAPGNRLFGDHNRLLAGRDWVQESFAGVNLQIGADTFFQVHTLQAERVVPLMLQALRRAEAQRLVDAYCGIGTFSLPLAATGIDVLGIEQHPGSIQRAVANAHRNRLANRCRFAVGDVAQVLPEALHGRDALLLDPPRKGINPALLEVLRKQGPALILYLSCDPATLARDLAGLVAIGPPDGARSDASGALHPPGPYAIESVQPIDFFPQTSHVETLVVLKRH